MIRKRTEKNKAIKEQEVQMMKDLWDLFPHRCEVTGKEIHEFTPWAFHHLLTKKAYPGFHLEPRNILICHPMIHVAIENGSIDDREKAWISELTDNLRSEYNERSRKNFGRFR